MYIVLTFREWYSTLWTLVKQNHYIERECHHLSSQPVDQDGKCCEFFWFGFDDVLRGSLFDINLNFHKALNLFKFDCEIRLESVPRTNQY